MTGVQTCALPISGFAKNVNRDDIVNGAAELGVDLDTHIAFVLDSMRGIRGELGL